MNGRSLDQNGDRGMEENLPDAGNGPWEGAGEQGV